MNSPASEEKNTPTDELVGRSLKGDHAAFRALMESQQQYAYALAFRLLHDADDAKDVVQDSFIRVWNNLASYRPEFKFTTWLYKIVVNLCYDRMKMESRRSNVFGYIAGLITAADVADKRDVHKDVENLDLREHILSTAKKLPPMERLVFHLRDIQDLSIDEIANIAGISVGSVKTNLCYARKRIRLALINIQESENQ